MDIYSSNKTELKQDPCNALLVCSGFSRYNWRV